MFLIRIFHYYHFIVSYQFVSYLFIYTQKEREVWYTKAIQSGLNAFIKNSKYVSNN